MITVKLAGVLHDFCASESATIIHSLKEADTLHACALQARMPHRETGARPKPPAKCDKMLKAGVRGARPLDLSQLNPAGAGGADLVMGDNLKL